MSTGRHTQIDPCLSIRDGRLFVEDCAVADLAQRFGTPLYVISEDHLRRNVRRFAQAFGERWPEGAVHVLPSIKANFTLALRHILTAEGAGCDTFGPAELEAALRTGMPPRLISVNGSVKEVGVIERAVAAGARLTLDSATELEAVRRVARALGVRAQVRFRLRPRYEGLDQPSDFYDGALPVRLAAQRYKPGIPIADLLRLGPEALAAEEMEVSGVMVHLGRHSADLAVWEGMVRSSVALIGELSRAWGGWEPREIDLGGGFPAPRDPTGRATAYGSARGHTPSLEEYAEVLTGTLRRELLRQGLHPAGKTLEVEPGRSLFADTGLHLAAVRHVKAQDEPVSWRWVETDTTEMFLLDTLVEHCRWTVYVAEKADQPAVQSADIVGLSCGFDVIVAQAQLPRVEQGDVIAFLDTGAYQEACAVNFNALPRPATVLVTGDRAEVIKRAETVDDVFRRDVIPPRLRDYGMASPAAAEVMR